MKTSTKKTKFAVKKPIRFRVASEVRPGPEVCSVCGKPAHAKWIDWETGKHYCWCKRHADKVKLSAPQSVQENYRVRERVRTSSAYFEPNEIELVIKGRGDCSTRKGRNAQICYDAWFHSIFPTDLENITQLYGIAPKSRYLIFDTDGKMHYKTRQYANAETLAGRDKVIVWWGGR